MRVLLIDRTIANWYSLGLAGGLRSHGVETRLGGPAKFDDSYDVVPVYPRAEVQGQHIAKLGDTAPGILTMRRLLRSFQPDVLHVQWASALDLLYVRLARRMTSAKVVFTVHNPAKRSESDADSWQVRLLPLADSLITLGPELRDQFCAAHPALADRTHVTDHGNFEHAVRRLPTETARKSLGIAPSDVVFVFLGQIRPFKGVEVLLEAYSDYLLAGREGMLLIVGTATHADYLAQLRALAARLSVAPRWLVSKHHLPHETFNLAASSATQIVLPFHEASHSGSLIFAMTHGRCVVSTTVGAVTRTLNGRGILVPPGDTGALAAALQRAADDPVGCERLASKARQYAMQELAWPRVAKRTIEIYAE